VRAPSLFRPPSGCRLTTIDLIIPAYGNLDITSRCVHAAALFGVPNQRITLVDNGSSQHKPEHDLTPLKAWLEATGHQFIRLDPNVGPYAAVNAGIRTTSAPLVAIVCNDVALLPGSLSLLIEAVSDAFPVIAANEIHGPYDTVDVINRVPQLDPVLIPGVFFSCVVIRRDVFDRVGLFDPNYRLTYGDTDWEQRYADSGGQNVRRQDAFVYHGCSVTRKRLGIDTDLRVDVGDYRTFQKKWRDRPDVLQKHPPEDVNLKRQFLQAEWPRIGHQ